MDHICAAMIVADDAGPPLPGQVKGTPCFCDTPTEAKALALRYLGGGVEPY